MKVNFIVRQENYCYPETGQSGKNLKVGMGIHITMSRVFYTFL
jgi:hypothetical protein